MKIKYILILYFCLLVNLFAHDQIVHQEITAHAENAAYADSSAYADFINTISSDIPRLPQPNQKGGVFQSMVDGSYDEDWADQDAGGKRSLNHFYDPLTGLGLSETPPDKPYAGGIGNPSFLWASTSNCIGINFPGVTRFNFGENENTSNIWSWPNARGYEWLGLTAATQLERQTNLDNMFRAIGQVMHLLEDTTQPQHVRNEQHLDKFVKGISTPWRSPIEDYGQDHWQTLNYGDGSMLNWRNAGFTKLEDFWNRHKYDGSSSAALVADANEDPNGGPNTLGLAEWCNANFLGARHMYADYYPKGDIRRYPYPSLHSTDYSQIQAKFPAAVHPIGLKNGQFGPSIYVNKTGDGIQFNDISRLTYIGASFPYSQLMTIYDDNVLSNYHNLLIPKAVKYAAGVIDYYFRGTMDVNSTDNGDGTFTLTIVNTSSQDFSGGAFHLFYDDANGNRTELTSGDFDASGYSGSLASNDSFDAIVTSQTNAARYVLVYQGTIGTASGQPSDPVDANIAIAVKDVTASLCWFNEQEDGTVDCYGGGSQTSTVDAGAVYSLISQADANQKAVALAQSQAQSQCPCHTGDSLSLSDAAWMPYYDPYNGQLSADGWTVSGGTATFDSTESELGGDTYYNNWCGIAQTICVPTSGYKLHCHISGSSNTGNDLTWCGGPGFGFWFNEWGGISDEGFDSDADLSVGSNEIFFKVLGYPYAPGPIHVEINFEIIAP